MRQAFFTRRKNENYKKNNSGVTAYNDNFNCKLHSLYRKARRGMKVQKRLNICLTVTLYAAVILSGIFVFSQSYARLFEALIDLYGSFIYYFKTLFGMQTDNLPSVTKYSEALKFQVNLPSDINGFKSNASTYFSLFFSKENFMSWLKFIGKKTSVIAKIITVILPCVIL